MYVYRYSSLLLSMHVCFVLFPLFDLSFVDFPSVLQYCWLGLLACKNRLPYNLYCVGGDVKHCTIQNPVYSDLLPNNQKTSHIQYTLRSWLDLWIVYFWMWSCGLLEWIIYGWIPCLSFSQWVQNFKLVIDYLIDLMMLDTCGCVLVIKMPKVTK